MQGGKQKRDYYNDKNIFDNNEERCQNNLQIITDEKDVHFRFSMRS